MVTSLLNHWSNIIGQLHPCLCVYYTNSKFEHLWNVIYNIVKPPNKGHIEDNINSLVVERLPSSWRLSMYWNCKLGRQFFGTSSSVPCRVVFCIVSLSRRVHNQRFHYTELSYACCMHTFVYVVCAYNICVYIPIIWNMRAIRVWITGYYMPGYDSGTNNQLWISFKGGISNRISCCKCIWKYG